MASAVVGAPAGADRHNRFEDTVHTAFNQGTDPITLVGTFFDVAPGEELGAGTPGLTGSPG
ncbi:MAG: hypothetical protein WBP61_14045 [Nocardioides sp.]